MANNTDWRKFGKWCPFARIQPAGDYVISTNGREHMTFMGDLNIRTLTSCIGDDCAAFRITKGKGGYCGLAGKP